MSQTATLDFSKATPIVERALGKLREAERMMTWARIPGNHVTHREINRFFRCDDVDLFAWDADPRPRKLFKKTLKKPNKKVLFNESDASHVLAAGRAIVVLNEFAELDEPAMAKDDGSPGPTWAQLYELTGFLEMDCLNKTRGAEHDIYGRSEAMRDLLVDMVPPLGVVEQVSCVFDVGLYLIRGLPLRHLHVLDGGGGGGGYTGYTMSDSKARGAALRLVGRDE